MKKIIATILTLAMLCCAVPMALAATAIGEKTLPYLDYRDEEDLELAITSANCTAWQGKVNGKVQIMTYHSYSVMGLFFKFDIVDEDYKASTAGTVVDGDCIQIGYNPGRIIEEGNQGIFFSMALNGEGEIEVMRHNYKDGLVTDKVTCSGEKTEKGWKGSVLIPWEEVNVVEGKTYTPEYRTYIDATVCYLDRSDMGNEDNCWKTAKPGIDVNEFVVESYPINFLVGKFPILTIGDVNEDLEIDSLDALYALQINVGIEEENAYNLISGDTNEDGAIDSVDALLILQYIVGSVETLPQPASN